jgi:hypothetical protein
MTRVSNQHDGINLAQEQPLSAPEILEAAQPSTATSISTPSPGVPAFPPAIAAGTEVVGGQPARALFL